MIEAFITNAGKYAEGELTGEWLKFPTTKEDVQALFSRIGVDGVSYEEYFITDYKSDISGLGMGEYERIDELNYLAALISEMSDFELDGFKAAAAYGDHGGSAKDFINIALNPDHYKHFHEVSNETELTEHYGGRDDMYALIDP